MSKRSTTTSTVPSHAGAVYRLLCELWPSNGYAVLPEVGNSTGARTRRHADAVVMSLWPSRGLDVLGVEIKVSRSDWISEMRKPEKADEIAKYCDHWYLAVSEASIVHAGELPSTWGLIACDTGKAKIIKPAPKLEAKSLDRGFVAAMLRRAAEFHVPETWLATERQRIYADAEASAKLGFESELKRAKDETERLRADISKFETESGFSIVGWRPKSSVATFKKVHRAIEEGDVTLTHTAERLERAATLMREAAVELANAPLIAEEVTP